MKQSERLNRRQFLKFGLVGAAAGLLTSEVARFKSEWLALPHGYFHFVGEDHTKGVGAELIPDETDILYLEKATIKPFDYKKCYIEPVKCEALRTAGDKIMAKNGELAWGDFHPHFLDSGWFTSIPGADHDKDRAEKAGTIAFFPAAALQVVAALMARSDRRREEPKFTTRRRAISLGAKLGFLLAASGVLPNQFNKEDVPVSSLHQKAMDRLYYRLHGLASHLQPYDVTIFVRNLYAANFILQQSEEKEKALGRLPYVTIAYGAKHEGIMDLLILGRPILRELLALLPEDLIAELVEQKGSLAGLCTSYSVGRDGQNIAHLDKQLLAKLS